MTFDSGTTYAAFPRDIYKSFKGKIPYFNEPLPCKSPKDYGDLTFIIEGDKYLLKNDDWIDLSRSKVYPPQQ